LAFIYERIVIKSVSRVEGKDVITASYNET